MEGFVEWHAEEYGGDHRPPLIRRSRTDCYCWNLSASAMINPFDPVVESVTFPAVPALNV